MWWEDKRKEYGTAQRYSGTELNQKIDVVDHFITFDARRAKFSRSQGGNLANKNPVKDFCWWDLDGVCLSLSSCSGRWLVGPFRTSNKLNKLFYLTRPQLALLKSLPYNDR
jgi:hypothetical protein